MLGFLRQPNLPGPGGDLRPHMGRGARLFVQRDRPRIPPDQPVYLTGQQQRVREGTI